MPMAVSSHNMNFSLNQRERESFKSIGQNLSISFSSSQKQDTHFSTHWKI